MVLTVKQAMTTVLYRTKFMRTKSSWKWIEDSHYPCPFMPAACTICAHTWNNTMLGCSPPNPSILLRTNFF